MNKFGIVRWLALWLALALVLPAAALGEEAPDDAIVVVEAVAEETAAELAENAILEPNGDEAQPEDAGESAQPAEEASQEAVTPTEEEVGAAEPSDAAEAEPVEAKPVVLAWNSLKLGLSEKRKLPLEGGVSAKSVGAVFSSSNKRVATVDKTAGWVSGKHKGTATITMKTADGTVSTCEVTVKKSPTRVKLSSKTLTLGVGEESALKATLSSGSASEITFSSNNKKVATVDENGRVVALKKGTAKITVRTFNGKKAVCKVTVKAAPKSVSFVDSAVTLWNGDDYTASVKFSKGSAGSYRLSSDDESVVTVSGNKLKAVGLGTTAVFVTTYNGATAAMSVEVLRRPVYRALLVGECTFPDTSYGDLPAKKDVSLMKSMLKNTKGPTKSKWSVTTRTNRTTGQIYDDIQTAFAGAEEGDVSLFYISTHGDQKLSIKGDTPEYAGYLMTYGDDRFDNWYDRNVMTLPCLASWLKEVPGQIIVIIDSCGSGAAIYGAKGNGSATGDAAATFSPGAFDGAVMNAFMSEDKGTVVQSMETGAFVLKNKFYVLASAAYQEACWTNNGKYSYFTKWLTEGVGTSGKMPADSNKNKLTTLNELYKYIKKRSEKATITDSKGTQYSQHVQVYPSGSGFELFYRK